MATNWTVTSGSLPPGLNIVVDTTTSVAYLRGNPRRIGTYSWTLTATDALGTTATKDYTLTVVPKLRKIGAYAYEATLPTGHTLTPYTFTQKIGAEDIGVTTESSFTLSVISGSLPPGITATLENVALQPSDQVGSYDYVWINFSGLPTVVGTYPFTLRVSSATRYVDYVVSIPIQSVTELPPEVQPVSYSLTSNKNQVNEGETVTFTLIVTGIPSGTSIPYTITGVSAADIVGGSLTGNFVVTKTTIAIPFAEANGLVGYNYIDIIYGEVTITIAADLLTESQETLTLTLRDVSPTTSSSVLVNDTSISPPVPTYRLTIVGPAGPLAGPPYSVTEGDVFSIVLTTTNVSDGTVLPYTITGVTSDQIGGAALSGNMIIGGSFGFGTVGTSGQASLLFYAAPDSLAGAKTFNFAIPSLNISTTITINDGPPTYNLTTNAQPDFTGVPTVAELPDTTVTFTLTTTSVPNYTTIAYTVAGVSSADINGAALSGNLTVVNNVAAITFTITNDSLTEGNELLTFSLPSISRSVTVKIADTSVTVTPTYTLSVTNYTNTPLNASVGITEGEQFRVRITGYNLPNGAQTLVNYSITGVDNSLIVEPLSGVIQLGYPIWNPLGINQGYEAYQLFTTINDNTNGQAIVTFTAAGQSVSFPLNSPPLPPPDNQPLPGGGGGETLVPGDYEFTIFDENLR